MSTNPNWINPEPEWKQEVNRRLAAHKSRKEPSPGDPAFPAEAQHGAAGRAAEAAERVAARFAKAPSYSEMLAEEARAAVRAAEAASRAALEAQSAAESILAGLEASSAAERIAVERAAAREAAARQATSSERVLEPAREEASRFIQSPAAILGDTARNASFGVRWQADLPARTEVHSATHASHGPLGADAALDTGWEPQAWPREGEGRQSSGIGGTDQSAHANLIEFPKELVAARKVRPRMAEGPLATERIERQLSIFEVDPETISTQPEAEVMTGAAQLGPEWSGIELEDRPAELPAPEMAAARAAAAPQLASAGRRMMASVVDSALISGVFLASSLAVATHLKAWPPIHSIEMGAAGALLALGILYQALFFTLSKATPGMRYAGISLCTFDNQEPTRAQLRIRVVGLLLSLLPLGLGIAWAIFDEDHLSWHDRLSGTYQRKC